MAVSLPRALLRALYPPHCAACQRPIPNGLVCAACHAGLAPLEPGRCCGCAALTAAAYCAGCAAHPDLDEAACYARYNERAPLAALIQRLKYRGDRALVRVLTPCLESAARRLTRPEAICYVPMRWRRRRRRGFNQAELLARALSDALELPLLHALRKTRRTPPQARLPQRARLGNLEGAFAATGAARTVWLVDDVRTTGATLAACAQALKEAGAHRVGALVLAAAPP